MGTVTADTTAAVPSVGPSLGTPSGCKNCAFCNGYDFDFYLWTRMRHLLHLDCGFGRAAASTASNALFSRRVVALALVKLAAIRSIRDYSKG